jgi:hypothetical protein
MTLRRILLGGLLALAVMLALSYAHASTLAPVLAAAPTADHVFNPPIVERIVKETVVQAPAAETKVELAWGEKLQRDWFPRLWIALTALAMWGMRRLPASVRFAISLYGEQKAMDQLHGLLASLIAGVSDDGKATYDLETGNKYVAMGLKLGMQNFPKLAALGEEQLRLKLISAVKLHPELSGLELMFTPPADAAPALAA